MDSLNLSPLRELDMLKNDPANKKLYRNLLENIPEKELKVNIVDISTKFLLNEYAKIVDGINKIPNDLRIATPSLAHRILCVTEWSRYKQLYSFDPNLMDYLLESVNAESIVSNMFLHKLPFPAFYVQSNIKCGKYTVEGFYVFLNTYSSVKAVEINASVKESNETFFYSINLEENSDIPLVKYISESSTDDSIYEIEKDDVYLEVLQKILILVTYLCTDKVEIVKRKEEYQPRSSKGAKKKTQKANVGIVGGEIVRLIKERKTRYIYEGAKEVTGRKKGKEKIPHFRRAHYHSFWTGKRDEPEKRQLIVKLLDPIFVNGTDKEIPVTERVVIKEDELNAERNMI